MSIVRWEPLREVMTLREAMDRLFEDSFVGRRPREWLPAEGSLALDMFQTEEDYIRRERRYGSVSRSLVLPEGLEAGKAEASFEDGILTLSIPKAPEAKPKVIKVKGKKK